MKLKRRRCLLTAFVATATVALLFSVCLAYDLSTVHSEAGTDAIDALDDIFDANVSDTDFTAPTFTVNTDDIVRAKDGNITFDGNVILESGAQLRVYSGRAITIAGTLTVNTDAAVIINDGGTLDLTGSSQAHTVPGRITIGAGNGDTVLKIGPGSTLTVSGTFENAGSGNEDLDYSLVTRSGAGSYTVMLSGTVDVRYARFSYLNDRGVTLNTGITEFNYITFDNPQGATASDSYLYLNNSAVNGTTFYGMRFVGTDEPEYAVEVEIGASNNVTMEAFETISGYLHGDGETSTVSGSVTWTYSPTAVTLRSFAARGYNAEVLIEWESATEFENIGYNLYRSQSGDGTLAKINTRLISGVGLSSLGGRYCFLDRDLTNGKTYYYILEDIDSRGRVTRHGPVSATPTEGAPRCDFDSASYTSWATSSGEFENVTIVEPLVEPDGTPALPPVEDPLFDDDPANVISIFPGDGDAQGSGSTEPGCSVVTRTENSVLIRIRIPEAVLGKVSVQDEVYDTVSVPGYGMACEPCRPELPSKGFLIGLPSDAPEVLPRVVETVFEGRDGITLYIPPRQDTNRFALHARLIGRILAERLGLPDGALQSCDSPPAPEGEGAADSEDKSAACEANTTKWEEYPESLCSVGEVVRIGTRRFILLNVRPVVYERVQNKVRCYREMLVELRFAYPPIRSPKKFWRGRTFSTQWDLAARGALKIRVSEDGLYKVSGARLLGAGFDASCEARDIKLFEGGRQVAIEVVGESDGRLDCDDYILFYGRKKATKYSDENTYWLACSPGRGMRMSYRSVSVPQHRPWRLAALRPCGPSFGATVHFEEDKIYWPNLPREGGDHWFWSVLIAPATRDFGFDLRGVAESDEAAKLTISLQGANESDTVSPDHAVSVSINGTKVKEVAFDGMTSHAEVIYFPQSLLAEGANLLTLEIAPMEGAPVNIVALNNFEITYQRTFTVHEDTLSFTLRSGQGFGLHSVHGFGSSDILLFDVTSPTRPVRLTGFRKIGSEVAQPLRGISICFMDNRLEGTRSLLALTEQKCLSPASIEENCPSTLHSDGNGADYIVITHKDFVPQANILASHRQAQGLRTAIVCVEDIYDEFSYGNPDARAIKGFLKRAFGSWCSPAPRYVLLLGDGTYDYKNNLGLENVEKKNFVPAYLLETPYMETASDNYYVCVSGEDKLPDLFIGRLPASSGTEADVMVRKIMEYDNLDAQESWLNKALFVADNDEPLFSQTMDELAGIVSSRLSSDDYVSFHCEKVYLSQLGSSEAREKTIAGLNAGALIAAYAGHGTIDLWAGEPILSCTDVDNLSNEGRLPFVLALNCLNGYFVYPYQEAIAEQFVRRSGGGAVAYWGATGLSTPDRQKLLGMNLFTSIFVNGRTCLGEATTVAKLLLAGDSEFTNIVDTWILFGDPATRLKLK